MMGMGNVIYRNIKVGVVIDELMVEMREVVGDWDRSFVPV